MADSGNGYAVGDVDVLRQHTGVLVKRAGDPTWRAVPATAFNPPINIALSSWAQDVHAIPASSIAFISWRDDYRSLVYKTTNNGANWFSVSPLNPILYGIRYTINFASPSEGLIVGEGPGRVHRTVDGGVTWRSYTIPVNPPLTDAKHSGSYWFVAGGDNMLFRYTPLTDRWTNLSFTQSIEYFPTHLKIHFVDDDFGYLTGYNQNRSVHVMKTTSGGLDWQPVQQQPPFNSNPEGHKGIFFFDSAKGWVASDYNEFAYTPDGGRTWTSYHPKLFNNKTYHPVNKMVFLNEALGWAVGGMQRKDGYPTVSTGWIMKWTGTQKPDISTTPILASFDTMACQASKVITVPIHNTGTGNLTISPGGITFSHPEFSLQNVVWPIIIQPGEIGEVDVRWEPDAEHYGPAQSGSFMAIESNDHENQPWTIELAGQRLLSRLEPRETNLVFPTVCLGESSEATLVVDTYGNVPPAILRVDLVSNQGNLILLSHAPGALIRDTDSLRFLLRADYSGSFAGSIQITAGNPDCPELIDISFLGMVESNTVEATPEILRFNQVCVGEEVTEYVQLKNIGTRAGELLELRQFGGDSLFTMLIDSGRIIDENASELIPIRFTPRALDTNSQSTQFHLVFGPCADTVIIVVNGQGIDAELELDADSLLIIGPAPLDHEITEIVTLHNPELLPTTVDTLFFDPHIPGLRFVEPTDIPFSLKGGEKIELRIAYLAASRDSLHTTLRVRWTEPCHGDIAHPVLLISDELPVADIPELLSFETQMCEEDVFDSLLIHNRGQVPLHLTMTTLVDGDMTHFRVVGPPLPLSIPPGDSAWLHLAYNAPVNGGSSASLIIQHNDLTVKGFSRVRLSGRKKVQTLTVTEVMSGPLRLCAGVEGRHSYILRNENADSLSLSSVDILEGGTFASLHSGELPVDVPPGGSFVFHTDVTLPFDTSVTIELQFVTEPCRAVHVLRFRAFVATPLLTVDPDPLDFGVLPVTDVETIALRLFNSDSIDVVVDSLYLRGVTSAMYFEQPLTAPQLLSPGASLVADITPRFVKDTGLVTGSLCAILSDPCPDTICFDIQVRFIDMPFNASHDTLRYVFAFCDSLHCDSIHITNTLTVPQLLLPAVTYASVFSVQPDTAIFLEPGERVVLEVCARIPVVERARGDLLLQSDIAPMTAVPLLAVREDRPLLVPDSVDAGNIPYCLSERSVLIPIGNPNGLKEDIFDIEIDDGFMLDSHVPFQLAGHSTDTLRLRAVPAGPGAFSGRLTIHSRSGDCERTTVIVLTGRSGEPYIDATPETLLFANVVAGTAQSRNLNIRNRDMEGLRLSDIILQPTAQFSTAINTPVDLAPGMSIDIPVVFQPAETGNYFGTMCLIIDQPCPDTICIALEGVAVEGALVFSMPQLRFDSLAYCEERVDTVLLHNTGSADVRLTSSSISGSGAPGYTLLNPITSDLSLPAGASHGFAIRFRAADVPDGSATASLFIRSDAPDQPLLELPLFGTRARHIVPSGLEFNLGAVLLGSALDFDVEIHNAGDAALLLDSIALPADYTLTQPLFPARIYGGMRAVLGLTLLPSREGSFVDTLRLFVGPCDDEVLLIVRGGALRQFVQNHLDFGDLPFCETRSGLVSMRNNGTESLTLTSLNITGTHAGAFHIENPPSLPYQLAPGEQLHLTLQITPLPAVFGTYTGRLRTGLELDGQSIDFHSDLRAVVTDGGLAFAGQVYLGSGEIGSVTAAIPVTGRNTASFPIRIESLHFPEQRLRLLSTDPALPAEIAPGDSLVIELTFTAHRLGDIGDEMVVIYGGPCPDSIQVPLFYEGFGQFIDLQLWADTVHGVVDDTVHIPVRIDRDLSALGIRRWSLEIGYNGSMLYPLGVETMATLSEGMTVTMTASSLGSLQIEARGEALRGDGDNLAILRFLVLIGDDSVTSLRPERIDLGHPALRIQAGDGMFTLTDYCFIDGSRLLGGGGLLRIASVHPNPSRGAAEIDFVLPVAEQYRISIYDARGGNITDVASGQGIEGLQRRSIDLSALTSGRYTLLLHTSRGAATGSITILR
ncbi:MAG: choice-of-anchor D domain-containing protein [Bacteroidetes bacterium]|nr:choice-of-anchor D domain-containing protein [Bacteroidota bacterium]